MWCSIKRLESRWLKFVVPLLVTTRYTGVKCIFAYVLEILRTYQSTNTFVAEEKELEKISVKYQCGKYFLPQMINDFVLKEMSNYIIR